MNLFTNHPYESGLTYWGHLKWALWSGIRLIASGLACIIHAFFPFLFSYTASNTIITISQELEDRELDIICELENCKFRGSE